MQRVWRAVAVLGVLVAIGSESGCQNLDKLPEGVCGNKVVEAGEACDSFVPGELGADLACGEPSGVAACRFVCSLAGVPRCPDGLACGSDGICRAPSGSFTGVTFNQPLSAGDDLLTAEIDSVRPNEVVTIDDGGTTVWFEPLSDAPRSRRLRRDTLTSPIAAPIDAASEGGDDLVLGGLGIAVSLGRPDSQLVPVALPTLIAPDFLDDAQPIFARIFKNEERDVPLFQIALSTASFLVAVDETGLIFLGSVAGPPAQRSGPVAVGNLKTVRESDGAPEPFPCEEIVIGTAGAEHVEVFFPCDDDGEIQGCSDPIACSFAPRDLALPGPLTAGPLIYDCNADGHLDIVAEVEGGGGRVAVVSYGLGNGSFSSSPPIQPDPPSDDAFGTTDLFDAPEGGYQEFPLAIGDLDGDAAPDFVVPSAIRLSDLGGTIVDDDIDNTGEPWVAAGIGDLNLTPGRDVAAVAANATSMSIYNAAGGGVFNPLTVELDAPAQALVLGDFDGDIVTDVALLSRDADGDSDALYVAFGKASGTPEPPRLLGVADALNEIGVASITASLFTTIAGEVDAIDELVLSGETGGRPALYILPGEGDRSLNAPLLLVRTAPDNLADFDIDFVRRLIPGAFTGPRQLAVLGLDVQNLAADHRFWLIENLGPGFTGADMQLTDATLPGDMAVWERGMYAALDVQGDEREEIIVFAPRADDPSKGMLAVTAPLATGELETQLAEVPFPVFRVDGFITPCRDELDPDKPECENPEFGKFAETTLTIPDQNGRLRTCDVDGDGRRDVVLLSVAPPGNAAASGLRIILNHGSVDPTQAIAATLPSGVNLHDVACLQADGDPASELVITTDAGIILYDPQRDESCIIAAGSGGGPGNETSVRCLSQPDPALAATRVAVGDFDGDGLDDIAAQRGGELIFLVAAEASP